jgi:hypothetical protein
MAPRAKKIPTPEPELEPCLKLDSTSKLTCPGDAVKLANRQGLYRYTKRLTDTVAEVVGPYFPGSPQRTQEITRVQVIVNLRPAPPRTPRSDVAMTPASSQLSKDAKRKK